MLGNVWILPCWAKDCQALVPFLIADMCKNGCQTVVILVELQHQGRFATEPLLCMLHEVSN